MLLTQHGQSPPEFALHCDMLLTQHGNPPLNLLCKFFPLLLGEGYCGGRFALIDTPHPSRQAVTPSPSGEGLVAPLLKGAVSEAD